ncbi:MAG: radical SAM family heme chaperone HemW [candidate division Zixibacteria bacterium]|nr:radical SAM family heme chaperone HemW [candidate division Zixibacteria bacterium]MCI0594977.1 radical SAM family heme chaperone HemW [candidate division Zixibacteria bacterium]
MSFGLYVHFPFCSKICPYCDFYVLRESEAKRAAFLPYYEKELKLLSEKKPELFSHKLETIYFGGGTPSLLEAEQLAALLKLIKRYFEVFSDAEISLEANPNDLLGDKPSSFRRLGINRLSIGVQSLNDDELKILGREHSAKQAEEAARNVKNSGFENFNIDLIFGIPSQTLISWEQTLEKAAKWKPAHVSTYSLTIEERTSFYKLAQAGELQLPPDEDCQEMYLRGVEFLEKEGCRQYEISNFARPGFQSRHNRNYWQRKSYLGLGPSAHSFFKNQRWANVRSLPVYQRKLDDGKMPLDFEETIDRQKAIEEALLLGLRQKEGICLENLKKEFGFDLEKEKNELLKELTAKDFIQIKNGQIRLTPPGFYVSDRIVSELFP